jgi:hypothetical protein
VPSQKEINAIAKELIQSVEIDPRILAGVCPESEPIWKEMKGGDDVPNPAQD